MSKTYHVAGLVLLFWNPMGHFGILWTPWGLLEQQEGHAGIRNQICNDFRMISGPHLESLLNSDGLNYILLRACFQVTFCTEFLMEILTFAAREKRSRSECIGKISLSQKSFFKMRGLNFRVFRMTWEQFSDSCCFGDVLKIDFFQSQIGDPEWLQRKNGPAGLRWKW